MSADTPVRFKQADVLNDREIVVEFSDHTVAVFTAEQLLALAPDREPSDKE